MNPADNNPLVVFASNGGNDAINNATRKQYTLLGFSRATGKRITKLHFDMAGGKGGALEKAKEIDKKLERVDVYDNGMRCRIRRYP